MSYWFGLASSIDKRGCVTQGNIDKSMCKDCKYAVNDVFSCFINISKRLVDEIDNFSYGCEKDFSEYFEEQEAVLIKGDELIILKKSLKKILKNINTAREQHLIPFVLTMLKLVEKSIEVKEDIEISP